MASTKYLPKVILVLITLLCYVTIKNISLSPASHEYQPSDRQEQIPQQTSTLPQKVKEIISEKVLPKSEKVVQKSMEYKAQESLWNDTECIKKYLGIPKYIAKSAKSEEYKDVTCSALLFGDGTEPVYDRARKFMDREV